MQVVTANGVDERFWADGPNAPHVFIFASHPERGLEQLLLAWPVRKVPHCFTLSKVLCSPLTRPDDEFGCSQAIAAAVPNASLRVYHGFPAGYGESGAPPRELARMRALRARVEGLLLQPGVDFRGFAGQRALALAYADSGLWLYPISMAETSCISAMKAMVRPHAA